MAERPLRRQLGCSKLDRVSWALFAGWAYRSENHTLVFWKSNCRTAVRYADQVSQASIIYLDAIWIPIRSPYFPRMSVFLLSPLFANFRQGDQCCRYVSYSDAGFYYREFKLSSWNKELIRQRGVAMAEEFKGKGINVALGPAMYVIVLSVCSVLNLYQEYSESPCRWVLSLNCNLVFTGF